MIGLHLHTIFSFSVYHRLLALTRKQIVLFCIYLFLISSIVFYFYASNVVKKNLPVFLKNFPHITIEKGQLIYPETPTYAISPSGKFKVLFDAKNSIPPANQELLQNQILMVVTKNTLFTPGPKQIQTRSIPTELSIDTTQEFLQSNQTEIASLIKVMAVLFSIVAIPIALLLDVTLAFCVLFTFRNLTRKFVHFKTILYWSIFLLGPLTILWYINLFFPVPLFVFAKLILCIIYAQQIFNLQEGN